MSVVRPIIKMCHFRRLSFWFHGQCGVTISYFAREMSSYIYSTLPPSDRSWMLRIPVKSSQIFAAIVTNLASHGGSVTRAPIWGAVSDVILFLFIVCPLVGTCSIWSYFLPCKPHPSSVRSEWLPALALGISLTLFSGAPLHSGWPCWSPVLWVELSLVSCFHLSNFCIFTSVWWRFHVEDWGFDTLPIGLCWPEWVSVVGSWLRTRWSIAAAGLSDWCVPVMGRPLREPWLCVGRCSDGPVLCQYRPTWLASCLVGLSPLWAPSIPTWPDAVVGLGMTVLFDGPSGRAVSLVQWPSPDTSIQSLTCSFHRAFSES